MQSWARVPSSNHARIFKCLLNIAADLILHLASDHYEAGRKKTYTDLSIIQYFSEGRCAVISANQSFPFIYPVINACLSGSLHILAGVHPTKSGRQHRAASRGAALTYGEDKL